MHLFADIGAGWIIALLLGVNALAYGAFAFDKHAARGARPRIRESDLILLSMLGGSLGALTAMHLHRHKTRKPLFRFGVPIILAGQLIASAYILLRGALQGI